MMLWQMGFKIQISIYYGFLEIIQKCSKLMFVRLIRKTKMADQVSEF